LRKSFEKYREKSYHHFNAKRSFYQARKARPKKVLNCDGKEVNFLQSRMSKIIHARLKLTREYSRGKTMKRLQTLLQKSTLQKLLLVALLMSSGLLMSGAWLSGASAQENNPETGVAQGILVGKGKGWIAVSVVSKEQGGQAQTVRLSPMWVGGLPKFGGGPDKRILAIFEQLKKGDHLKFAWLRDGNNLYVTNIQVLPPQGDDAGQE
jgi:hypothetical protein